jgi:hypothetical protein
MILKKRENMKSRCSSREKAFVLFFVFLCQNKMKKKKLIISNLFSDLRRLNSTSYIRLLFCLVPLITIYLSHSRPLTHFSQFFFFHLCLPLPFLLISYIFFSSFLSHLCLPLSFFSSFHFPNFLCIYIFFISYSTAPST